MFSSSCSSLRHPCPGCSPFPTLVESNLGIMIPTYLSPPFARNFLVVGVERLTIAPLPFLPSPVVLSRTTDAVALSSRGTEEMSEGRSPVSFIWSMGRCLLGSLFKKRTRRSPPNNDSSLSTSHTCSPPPSDRRKRASSSS
jgi:hypothetical protein